jgi:hypothetical protein
MEASKPLKILNELSRIDGVKKKVWPPFTLNTSKFANKQTKTLGNSMIGSTLISKLQSNFPPKSAIFQHYLKSFEGTLQFTLKDRLPTTLEETQDAACHIEENLKYNGAIHQVDFLNNDDIWELNKESMGGLEHDLPEILEVENNTFYRKWRTGFSNMKDALNFFKTT